MVDFACRNISKEDILRCSFNLNKTEYLVLTALFSGQHAIKEISSSTSLDRTTIQKAIKGLIAKRIILRKKCLSAYVYYIEDKVQFKKELSKIISQWYSSVRKEIKKI